MSAYVKYATKYVITAYDSEICYIMYAHKGKICDKHMQELHMFLHIQNRQEHMWKEHIINM
jgi:hypothetical protein